jgi:hypothetical protein
MLRRMPRCMNRLDTNPANHEPIAMFKKMGVESPRRPTVSPIRPAHRGEIEVNVTIVGELLRPTDEVCMDMRLCDCADAQPIFPRKFSISIDVAFGVNDQSGLGLLAANQIGVLSKLRIKDLPEEHNGNIAEIKPLDREFRVRSMVGRKMSLEPLWAIASGIAYFIAVFLKSAPLHR